MEINKKCVAISSAVVVGLIILVVIISVSVSGSSKVSSQQSGLNFSQEQCSYMNSEGRQVTISYTTDASGAVEAKAEQGFVSDPVAELELCKKGSDVNFDNFSDDLDKVFGDNQSGFSKRETRSVGINEGNPHAGRQWGVHAAPHNTPVQSQTVSQRSNGGGAQHQEIIQNGVTSGTCSYVDKKGRSVTVTYIKRPNGKVKVETKDTFVTKPKRAYRSCMAIARSQEGVAARGRAQNSGTHSKTVFQSSAGGSTGAQRQEATRNGVTIGTCSYEDKQGQLITITYRKKSNGKIKAKSESPSVVKPRKSLKACMRAVKIQEQKMEAEMAKSMEKLWGSLSGISGSASSQG